MRWKPITILRKAAVFLASGLKGAVPVLGVRRSPDRSSPVVRLSLLLVVFVTAATKPLPLPAETGGRAGRGDRTPASHPLMPGIRLPELWDRNWPRTLHDRLATGFSPLVCGMREPPVVWGRMELPGTLNWVRTVRLASGEAALLVDDGRLRLIAADGRVRWRRPSLGAVVYQGDLGIEGRDVFLATAGPQLSLVDLRDGRTLWTHAFEPAYVSLRVAVGKLCPERPGLQAAVFFNYGEQGCVIDFPPAGQPAFVWKKRVVDAGEFDERYDHRCTVLLDLSEPEAPVIWNVRRFRCRGFDARTGRRISSLVYQIGGARRRSYGPSLLGWGHHRTRLACVFGEQVQTHVHAIRLKRDGQNELAWQHYYGEIYKEAPGVALASHGVVDIDGDGASEMVYSVRDPARNYRSFVRVRDAETGRIVFELPDHWGCGLFSGVGEDGAAGLLAFAAPDGTMPTRGTFEVYRFAEGRLPERLADFAHSRLWGPMVVPAETGRELLIRHDRSETGADRLVRYTIADGRLVETASTTAPELLARQVRAVIDAPSAAGRAFVVASGDGQLAAYRFSGERLWHLPLRGGAAAALSAADLDGDGPAELIAETATGRLKVVAWTESGKARQRVDLEYRAGWPGRSPALYDLLGTGKLCLLANGTGADGRLAVRAHQADGRLVWETPLDVDAQLVRECVLTPGRFLGPNHAGVAVSVADRCRVYEGTTMLDGRTGRVVWQKRLYTKDGITMPYLARGVPTAYDFDHDGVEELGIDLLSYMAYLKGNSGEFVYVRHTRNIRHEEAVYAGHLYSTYCPIYRKPADRKPYWFPIVGFDTFGLIEPDPRKGVWRESLGYDVPPNFALVDVDGDRSLEVGYAPRGKATFVCRDLWTGQVEWSLALPSPPNSRTITADVDGDGKGEFLCGRFCIGTDRRGRGNLRWQAPLPLGRPIIADFDGDGRGEIAVSRPGEVVILRAAGR